MAQQPSSQDQQRLTELVGRVFTDASFARAMEQNPEQALKDAGYQLNAAQTRALQQGREQVRSLATQDAASVAAFVQPVVQVLTKGTQPVVTVVVRSATVASAERQE